MNRITENIFKHYKPDFEKLQKYGFEKSDCGCVYKTQIMNEQFELSITVSNDDIKTEVIDLAVNEPYTLFLVESASGGFVGAVRAEFETVMLDIAQKCFDKCVFKSEYAQKIIRYVADVYGDELEFLWEKFSDNAVWRRKDNKKWYALLLTVTENKIGLPSNERVEIIDLRANAESIDKIVDNKTVFGGYHMNKKHWITIRLDGSVPLEKIERMLDESYKSAL